MLRALRMWPWANSPASRTSSTSESFLFISIVASSVFTDGPPVPRRTSGHTSIPPLTKAIAMRKMFSVTNLTRKSGIEAAYYRIA